MVGSKYEREIRFIGKEVVRLSALIEEIKAGNGSGDPEKDKADIAEMEAKIAEYSARRKEIEDSYIAVGLELPLDSRNLNASVYSIGASFEPNGTSYRLAAMAEAEGNAKAYVPSGVDLSDDPTELTHRMNLLSDQISAIERASMEAELNEDMGEKVRLDEEAMKLRAQRSDIFQKIKSLKSAEANIKPDVSRLDKLESDTASLKAQMSAMRQDIGDLKLLLANIADRLGVDEF